MRRIVASPPLFGLRNVAAARTYGLFKAVLAAYSWDTLFNSPSLSRVPLGLPYEGVGELFERPRTHARSPLVSSTGKKKAMATTWSVDQPEGVLIFSPTHLVVKRDDLLITCSTFFDLLAAFHFPAMLRRWTRHVSRRLSAHCRRSSVVTCWDKMGSIPLQSFCVDNFLYPAGSPASVGLQS
uniref:Uncharacterized protein n=1 Tax=Trichuris muris TaxID=70415 RepID=A0A5S6QZI8_TRIMR